MPSAIVSDRRARRSPHRHRWRCALTLDRAARRRRSPTKPSEPGPASTPSTITLSFGRGGVVGPGQAQARTSSSAPRSAASGADAASSMNASYVPDSSPGAVICSASVGRVVVEPSSVARVCASSSPAARQDLPAATVSDSGPKMRVQVGLGQAVDRGVGMGHDGDPVVADLELGEVDAVVGAQPRPRCRLIWRERDRRRRRRRRRRTGEAGARARAVDSEAEVGLAALKSSETACEMGSTVEEPWMSTLPLTPTGPLEPAVGDAELGPALGAELAAELGAELEAELGADVAELPPHAARTSAAATVSPTFRVVVVKDTSDFSPLLDDFGSSVGFARQRRIGGSLTSR